MRLIAIEGPDRLGKSTQIQRLLSRLRDSMLHVDLHKIPFQDHALRDRIYQMLSTGEAVWCPVVFQSFMAANRHNFQRDVLSKLVEPSVVLLDRWSTSTWVYGRASGVPDRATAIMLRGLVEPDMVLVFDGEPFPHPDKPDAYEADSDFQQRVREGYRQWAAEHDHAVVVNANQTEDEVAEEVWRAVRKLFD